MTLRTKHQKRPVKVREKDEATTEPYAPPPVWEIDPLTWDIPCVDDALPEGFTLHQGHTGSEERPVYNIEIYADPEDPELTWDEAVELLRQDLEMDEDPDEVHRKLGGYAAYLKAYCNKDMGNCYLSAQYVFNAFRGKCLSNAMFREMTNMADREGIQLNLDAQPFERKAWWKEEWADEPLLDLKKADTEELVDYYKQFGFKPVGEMKEVNGGVWKQYMTRKPQAPKD